MTPCTKHRRRFPQILFTFTVLFFWLVEQHGQCLPRLFGTSLRANNVILARNLGAELSSMAKFASRYSYSTFSKLSKPLKKRLITFWMLAWEPGCKSDFLYLFSFLFLPSTHLCSSCGLSSIMTCIIICQLMHLFVEWPGDIYSQRRGLTYAHSEYRLVLRFPFCFVSRFEKSLESGHVFAGLVSPIFNACFGWVGLFSLPPS